MNTMDDEAVEITRIEAWACRHPIDRPVMTSFGTMRDRPAVFVRLEERRGCFGWGEIFANWPASGAEHRVNLLMQDIAELAVAEPVAAPADLFARLSDATAIRALQCGEWGPFRQVIAGLDIALWDLFARRAGMPLRTYLDPSARDRVPAYASGIAIRDAGGMIASARAAGFDAFKVKVGFGDEDIGRLSEQFDALADDERLCADANQAWDLPAALDFVERAAGFGLQWLEEPIRADAPDEAWQVLARHTGIPLAGGENIAGMEAFSSAIETGALAVLQPDVAKWGGITGCRAVAEAALAAGKRYCPHFLGGGIGLAASAELLAAIGGDGRLEVDVNDNPLRDGFWPMAEAVHDGRWHMSEAPGLGIEQLPEAARSCVTLYRAWE